MISRWNSVLEKNKVENNNKQTSKKSLSSNPLLGAASNPIVDKIVKTVAPKKTEETTKKITNPFSETTNSIVAKINNFNTYRTTNRMYSGGITNPVATNDRIINYADLLQELGENFKQSGSLNEAFSSINSTFNEKMDCNFTAFGVFHEKSKCINLKLYTKRGETYSSKILLSDENNPVIKFNGSFAG